MDLRQLVRAGRSWLPLLVVAVVAASLTGYFISSLMPRVYEAKATLIVGESLSSANPDIYQLQVSQSLVSTYVAIAKTQPILDKVAASIGGSVATKDLAKQISVTAAPDLPLFTIAAQDTDPARAAAIANAMASALIESAPAVQGHEQTYLDSVNQALADTEALMKSTQAQIDQLLALDTRTEKQDADLATLQNQMVNLRTSYASLLGYSSGNSTNRLSVVEPASVPVDAVAPSKLLNTLLAGALGALAVLGIAFVSAQLDDRIKDTDTVRELTGLATLGIVPKMVGQRGRSEIYRLVSLLYPHSSLTESYRALRTNLDFVSVASPFRSLMVASAAGGDGKTVTACNLAVVFAQAGRRVMLVDADLRLPGVHTLFDLPNDRGLTTLLRDPNVGLDKVWHQTQDPNLHVLTTGPLPPNPAETLGSVRMRVVMAGLLAAADVVIFDSPPAQTLADAAVLGSQVDGVLLVVAADRGGRRGVRRAIEAFERAGANVVGVVLNRVRSTEDLGYGEYYLGVPEADGTGTVPQAAAVPPRAAR